MIKARLQALFSPFKPSFLGGFFSPTLETETVTALTRYFTSPDFKQKSQDQYLYASDFFNFLDEKEKDPVNRYMQVQQALPPKKQSPLYRAISQWRDHGALTQDDSTLPSEAYRLIMQARTAAVKMIGTTFSLDTTGHPSDPKWENMFAQIICPSDVRPDRMIDRRDAVIDVGFDPRKNEFVAAEELRENYDPTVLHHATVKHSISLLPRDGKMKLFGTDTRYGIGLLFDLRLCDAMNERFVFATEAQTCNDWWVRTDAAAKALQAQYPALTINALRENTGLNELAKQAREYNELLVGLTAKSVKGIVLQPAVDAPEVRDSHDYYEARFAAIEKKISASDKLEKILSIIIVDAEKGVSEYTIAQQNADLEKYLRQHRDCPKRDVFKAMLAFNHQHPEVEKVKERDTSPLRKETAIQLRQLLQRLVLESDDVNASAFHREISTAYEQHTELLPQADLSSFMQLLWLKRHIQDLQPQADYPAHQAAITTLNQFAAQPISYSETNFTEKLAALSSRYEALIQLDNFVTYFNNASLRGTEYKECSDYVTRRINAAYEIFASGADGYAALKEDVDFSHIQQIHPIIQTIHRLPLDSTNERRRSAQLRLKTLATQFYEKQPSQTTAEQIKQLKQAVKEFTMLDNAALELSKISRLYAGKNPQRLAAVQEINQAIKQAYASYAVGVKPLDCLQTLYGRVKHVRDNAQHQHKQFGALRFFGRFQPNSRFVIACDNQLAKIHRTTPITRLFQLLISQKQGQTYAATTQRYSQKNPARHRSQFTLR